MSAPTLGLLAPWWGPATWLVAGVVLLVLAALTVVCVVRARRLDRLHRRTDAARAALADALERRAAVAVQVSRALGRPRAALRPVGPRSASPDDHAAALHAAALHAAALHATALHAAALHAAALHATALHATALHAAATDALSACRDAMRAAGRALDPCEVAENALTRRLAALDRGALPAVLAADLADAEQLVLLARHVHNDAVRDTLDLRSRRLVRWLRLAGTAAAPAYFEIADPGGLRDAADRPAAAATGTG